MDDEEWKHRVIELLKDTINDHRNIDSGGYNECEKPEQRCMWCTEAQELIKSGCGHFNKKKKKMKKRKGIYKKAAYKLKVGLVEDDDGNTLMVFRKPKGCKKYLSEYVYMPTPFQIRELKHIWDNVQEDITKQMKG